MAGAIDSKWVDWTGYVLGAVESGWDWGAVYRDDPITLGMWQFYAYEACDFIKDLKTYASDAYNLLSERLRTFYESHKDRGDDNGPWTTYWMTDEDEAAFKECAKTDNCKTSQKRVFTQQAGVKYNAIQNWGADYVSGASHIGDKAAMIFLYTIYHQSPQACLNVISSLPWKFTVDDVYNLALNDSIVGKYKSRQDRVYELLNENKDAIDNGDAAPENYGTSSDPSTDPAAGGASGGVSQAQTNLNHIKRVGDALWLYYNDRTIVTFYKCGGEVWKPSRSSTTPSTDQNELPSSGSRDYPAATTAELQSLIDYAISWEGKLQYVYGGEGRLNWQESGVTDCSGFVWGLFNHQFGVDIGTYTVPQADNSAAFTEVYNGAYPPDESLMQPADLIFYSFPSQNTHPYREHTNDHVELYLGNSTTIGMRGGTGPSEVPFSHFGSGDDGYCDQCWVRRYKQS